MDERGNVYADDENRIPERDKDRLRELGRLLEEDERELGALSPDVRARAKEQWDAALRHSCS